MAKTRRPTKTRLTTLQELGEGHGLAVELPDIEAMLASKARRIDPDSPAFKAAAEYAFAIGASVADHKLRWIIERYLEEVAR
jgi:hypothetical protein